LCSEDQIIWVIGKRVDQRFIATETTQQNIKIELA
jgi:tRNA(Ile)-lysidine synthase